MLVDCCGVEYVALASIFKQNMYTKDNMSDLHYIYASMWHQISCITARAANLLNDDSLKLFLFDNLFCNNHYLPSHPVGF